MPQPDDNHFDERRPLATAPARERTTRMDDNHLGHDEQKPRLGAVPTPSRFVDVRRLGCLHRLGQLDHRAREHVSCDPLKLGDHPDGDR